MIDRTSKEFHDAMMCAFDEAADGVELWEFAGAESEREQVLHKLAGAEVAGRIRAMANRYCNKHIKPSMARRA